jgi:hypothetical protein
MMRCWNDWNSVVKTFVWITALSLAGAANAATEIKRLSPILGPSQIPAQCRVVSVLKDSPAEKAGIVVGDILQSVNNQIPSDASVLAALVSSAPEDAEFAVMKKEGEVQHLRAHLNANRPRLGAVCDLTGLVKPGVTAAGNESITIFDGPYALTASGIIDKGIAFLRVRVSNDSDGPLTVGPELFSAADGSGAAMKILSPKDVMCMLYGEKGAHLLALKKVHKETLDAHESIPGMQAAEDERCTVPAQGKLRSADSQYAEMNAQYLATESLWAAVYQPGESADGLLYLAEPSSLPVIIKGTVEGHVMTAQLGLPQVSSKQMKHSELTAFFEAQTKGASLRLSLRKGKVFVGKFASYDADNERVWFNTPSGVLNTTSFSVESIRDAEPLEQVPAKPTSGSDHLN